MVSLLLSKSTSQLHLTDKHNRTALHLASGSGQIHMVGMLLGQGADINAEDCVSEAMLIKDKTSLLINKARHFIAGLYVACTALLMKSWVMEQDTRDIAEN